MLNLFTQNIEAKALLELVPGNVCVLDEAGVITCVNESWNNTFQPCTDMGFPGLITDSNYLDLGERWKILSEKEAGGIRSVLEGNSSFYETVYLCQHFEKKKWFQLRAVSTSDQIGCLIFKLDVSDGKIAEEKNEINEGILEGLIDNSPAIIYMKDMSGKYTHVNKAFEEAIGVNKKDVVGKKPYDIFPWDIAERFVKNDRKIIGTLEPHILEEQFCVAGSSKTFHSIQFPLRNIGGEPVGIACISLDITARKNAEEELLKYKNELEESLKSNEEKLQLFLDATTDGIWDWDLITGDVFFSPGWISSLGYDAEDLEPNIHTWKNLMHPDDLPKAMKALNEHFDGKRDSYQCENRLLRKDGSWRWNLDLGRVVKKDSKGNPLRMVGSDTDISGLKKAEIALSSSELHLAQAQKMASLGSWEYDVENKDLIWSDEMYRIFGINKDSFKTTYDAFLAMIHPEERTWVHDHNVNNTRDNKSYDVTHRIVLPNGSIRVVQEKSKTVFNKGGRAERVFGTVLDITEKSIIEENLKKSSQQLRDLSNKLQTIREEEKKRISREIHDELGQTLTAIKLDLTWLEKRVDVSEPPVKDKIKSIHSHLEESLETVRRVSTELRPQVLDVMGFCEALHWQVEKFSENTNIKYVLNIEPEGVRLEPKLSTDLFRIFQEALTNVSRHSQATKVMIDFMVNKTDYILSVRDDGVGIHGSRVHHSNSLGLLGMRERALIWKGHVEINGVLGEGTLLKVKIPKLKNDQ